jgi:DNA-binding FadR family transcriptional regulator
MKGVIIALMVATATASASDLEDILRDIKREQDWAEFDRSMDYYRERREAREREQEHQEILDAIRESRRRDSLDW